MYKLDHLPSLLEQQAIQRRRRLDEERKLRIFDPKVRTLGIDVAGLDEQIRIKKELQDLEKQRNNAADHVAHQTNELLQVLDAKLAASRRSHHQDIDHFRQAFQKASMRRDYDLYDPEILKKELPARVSDDDPRLTVSGLQKFEGEDLNKSTRFHLQKDQAKLWAWQSLVSKHHQWNQTKKEDQLYDQAIQSDVEAIRFLEEQAEKLKKEQLIADKNFNLQLAMEKKLRELDEKQLEELKNLTEIQTMINGDFLSESLSSKLKDSNKVRVDAFKGISTDQLREIYETRERQIKETQELHEKEKKENELWMRSQTSMAKAAMILEREKERHRRYFNQQLLQQNQQQAEQLKARQMHLDKVVYTNPPTQAFFDQFNTTSR